MRNSYGNYVVQKALNLANFEQKSKLISSIVKNIKKLGDRKLIFKWQSIVGTHLEFKIEEVQRTRKNYNTVVINNDNGTIFQNDCIRNNNRNNTEIKGKIVNNNNGYMK
jgi:hypothetical protein